MGDLPRLKPLYWVGSSKRDLRALPQNVVDVFGYALYLAQTGRKHEQAKPLKGFGSAGVLEIVEDWRRNTYRAVYAVRFERAVFVLHVFQKKAKRGTATPKADLDLIRQRLKGRRGCREFGVMRKERVDHGMSLREGSRSVYADLSYPDPGGMMVKAQLVTKIGDIIRQRSLTQDEAAELLGLTQPKVSKLLKGQFRGISEQRLLRCLTSLGRDVEIVVRPAPRRRTGKLSVLFAAQVENRHSFR